MGFMDKADIFKLIEQEHIYLAVSLFLIFIIIFGIPTDFRSVKDYLTFIFLVIIYLLLKEISKSFFLRDLFLKNILVNSEIDLRRMGIKNYYSELPDKTREEIKRIDTYSNKFISEYILSFFLILVSVVMILLNILGLFLFKPLTLEAFDVPGVIITFFVLIINLICFINSKKEISEYIVNQNDIYMSFRR